MDDAEHFKTMRNEEKFSNLGPGSYDVSISWAPDSFMKYDRNRIMSRSRSNISTAASSSSQTRFRTQYEKSWIQTKSKPSIIDSSILTNTTTKFKKSISSHNNDDKDYNHSNDNGERSFTIINKTKKYKELNPLKAIQQITEEIDSVRNLPKI
jgi:hypothetical protein